jgi:hypothetical protein
MRARSKTEVKGAVVRRHRSLVAVSFTLFLSTAGVLAFFGPADAATTRQLLPPSPTRSACPPGTIPLAGDYEGLCMTADGVIVTITGEILYRPPPKLPVNPPTLPPSTQPPTGTQPNPGPGTSPKTGGAPSSGGRTHLISSSITSSHSYGTPYDVYFGNFGGGQTFFSPGLSQYETYQKVLYVSAFGRPLNSDVSTAVIDATRVTPVSTKVPHAPDEVWLLLPFGLVLLTMVTYLVLEPDTDRVLR